MHFSNHSPYLRSDTHNNLRVQKLLISTDDCEKSINLNVNQSTVVTSPAYPGPYPNFQDCFWYFTSSDPNGAYLITLYIAVVETFYDSISVGLGDNATIESTVEYLETPMVLTYVTVNASTMWLKFYSDQSVGFEGFLAKVERTVQKGMVY